MGVLGAIVCALSALPLQFHDGLLKTFVGTIYKRSVYIYLHLLFVLEQLKSFPEKWWKREEGKEKKFQQQPLQATP
jgi:hypothetical protein